MVGRGPEGMRDDISAKRRILYSSASDRIMGKKIKG